MEITILGCGTSTGVPLLFCKCAVCTSDAKQNKRLRSSIWVKIDGKSFLVDTSPDLRQQALRAKIPRIDAILYTHPHADHVSGIDEVRSFNFIQKERIPAYAHDWTRKELTSRFPYIFQDEEPYEGGGIAQIDIVPFQLTDSALTISGCEIQPLSLMHGSQPVAGFRFNHQSMSAAYLTDCNHIPDETLERLKNLDVLILDCLRIQPHSTHFHLEESLRAVEKISAKRSYLTHLGHDLDYFETTKILPKNVSVAYDELTIVVSKVNEETNV